MTQLTWQGVSGSGQALPPRSSAGLLPLKVRQLQAGVLEPTPTARQGRDVLLQAKAWPYTLMAPSPREPTTEGRYTQRNSFAISPQTRAP